MAQSKRIVGEQPFQMDSHSFAVSPSNESWKLEGSADCVSFGEFGTTVSANEVAAVTNAPRGMWWRLRGNNSTVTITW